MNLLKIGEDGDVSNYIPNSEWTLVRMHVDRNVVFYSCCAEPYPDITYTRRPGRRPTPHAGFVLPDATNHYR